MCRNFDDYPGFQPFRSWANTYAQDCMKSYQTLVTKLQFQLSICKMLLGNGKLKCKFAY